MMRFVSSSCRGCPIILGFFLSYLYQTNAFSQLHTRSLNKAGTALFVQRDPIRMPTNTPLVPIETRSPYGDYYTQFIDLESYYMKQRTLIIGKYIDSDTANQIIASLIHLRQEKRKADITLYFNVPGAALRPALAVYDLIQQAKETCTIKTVNLGLCTGMGALLVAGGTKGHRKAMPNSRFLLQRTGILYDETVQGQAIDVALEVKNIKTWNDNVEYELHKLTNQPMARIEQDLKRDFYLSSEEAVKYGLIDEVLLPPGGYRQYKWDVKLGDIKRPEYRDYGPTRPSRRSDVAPETDTTK